MSKHTRKKIEYTVIHPVAERVGAIALTALSLLVSFEAIAEHHPKFGHHAAHDDESKPAVTEIFARGETKGETARLPEEFDIGLQTPHVGGL